MIAPTDVKIKKVAFFGDAQAQTNQKHYRDAFKVAKLLAENGYEIVNGGGAGVMEAASLGAKEGGGKVELVMLDPAKEPGNYEGIAKINYELADKKIFTKSYPSRLNRLVKEADAFVVFKGGTGTLSEIGMVWELAKFDYGHHEPIIFYGGFWKKIIYAIVRGLNFEKMEKRVVQVAESPEKVLWLLKKSGNHD